MSESPSSPRVEAGTSPVGVVQSSYTTGIVIGLVVGAVLCWITLALLK